MKLVKKSNGLAALLHNKWKDNRGDDDDGGDDDHDDDDDYRCNISGIK